MNLLNETWLSWTNRLSVWFWLTWFFPLSESMFLKQICWMNDFLTCLFRSSMNKDAVQTDRLFKWMIQWLSCCLPWLRLIHSFDIYSYELRKNIFFIYYIYSSCLRISSKMFSFPYAVFSLCAAPVHTVFWPLSLSHITHSWLSFNELLMQILCSWRISDPWHFVPVEANGLLISDASL